MVLVIAGWTAACCFLAVTQLEMLGMLIRRPRQSLRRPPGRRQVVGMKLYTSKVVAQWLGLTERRVRQLRDEGVIAGGPARPL